MPRLLISRIASGILLVALPGFGGAGSAGLARAADTEPVEEILVSGELPGPGLWKLTQGDHTLWILGTVSPLPKKMQWRSKSVEQAIAGSQQVIGETHVTTNVGFFRSVTLIPSLLKARENANGTTLQQILPPSLFARWTRLRQRYVGESSAIERWRPVFAAQELYGRALEKSGLSARSVVWPTVLHLAHEHRVKVSKVEVQVDIGDPKLLIRDFKGNPSAAEILCLEATVDYLEHELDGMKSRAEAWAIGDIDRLRASPGVERDAQCLAAATSASIVNQRFESAREKLWSDWVNQALSALANNRSTFAVLPMSEILQPHGRLERLRQHGVTVQAP